MKLFASADRIELILLAVSHTNKAWLSVAELAGNGKDRQVGLGAKRNVILVRPHSVLVPNQVSPDPR